ncbi:M20/M25/M40 family metallo-hydrolase [Herbidospora daliensis]|uniref:M20/M25/M40 family metallo-hydrolase n=1 Tax=Herbidospora daliensis TaxID=295585 RepID=UPI0007806DA5|nr:M20/M25/M40 family metallo-hydrolase [Herbidospora daliensis]
MRPPVGEFLADLEAWVRIPSVSAVAGHAPDVARSARWLAAYLEEMGCPEVEEWPTGGGTAVYARWPRPHPDAPTVLVYSHHDVREVRPDHWRETPPFDPVVRRGRVYGRGASDAKGQVLCHLWALRTLLAAGDLPVGVTLLVEGEEEIGSPHLTGLLAEHGDRLAADLVILSDTLLWSAGQPAVCTGVRGLVGLTLEIRGPAVDVHAGVASGAAPNPLRELCRLLGGLVDGDGRITVPDFYDAVAETPPELAFFPFDPGDWLARTRTSFIGGEKGRSVPERLWTRPAVEIEQVLGGTGVTSSRGVIPSAASASLVFHIVQGQNSGKAAAQIRQWVSEQVTDGYEYTLTFADTLSEPYVTPPGHPAVAALERAMSRAWGRPAGRMRNGGGAPADLLARRLDSPVVFFGTGLPEDRWHDADESADVGVLLKGVQTLVHLLGEELTA